MFLCHLLVVFLLGTVANGMTATDHTTHSTTDYVSTLGGSTASTSEAPGTTSPTTTSSTYTPSQQGTTTVLSTTLETSNSPPSPTATEEQSTTTVKSTTESTTDESTTTLTASTTSSTETGSTPSVSTSVTTEMMSSHLPTESITTHSATTLEVSDTTMSESASSSTTGPVDFTSTPHSGTTLSSETTKTSLPSTTMTDHTTETTGLTHSTEPTIGVSTTVSTSTVLTTTDNTSSTVNPTSTTMRPTDITNNLTTTPPQTTTPIPPVIECPARPCPAESVCLSGSCQCISGSYLQNGRCTPAQVFPGQLHLTSLTFQSEMRDRTSAIFLNTAANISATLRDVFENVLGYIKSDVVELTPGSVQATVNNIFEETNATQDSVDELIKEAINSSSDGLLAQATYSGTSLCDQVPTPCDGFTTTCSLRDGKALCTCRGDFVPDVYSTLSCRACPSGYMAVEETCQPCPFGYSGFNCDDSSLLAVVVISCVLGGVLLIMVLSLLIYCIWRSCTNGKTEYNNSPYPVESFSGALSSQGITPIPRATTKWDAAPPIEMTEGGSTHNLVDKNNQTNGGTGSYDLNPDRMKTFKGKNPSRYSYLVQGHENPYFLPGDDKRN